MSSHVNLIRMDSTSYTCCYGNDVFSYQVRCPKTALIFFPGDIQDMESKMNQSKIARDYFEYSYENTLQILHNKYKDSNIFIVRPSLKSADISLYGKYLNCDKNGDISEYNPEGNATQALFLLIENYLCNDNEHLPIILMGFSRGGLVLNQILCESGSAIYSSFIFSRIVEMHWLDCGNGIKEMCYPFLSSNALSALSHYSQSIRFYFHMTSYLYSENSSCINYQLCKRLCEQLQEVGFHVWSHFYSKEFIQYGVIDSLRQHFSLLYEFHSSLVC